MAISVEAAERQLDRVLGFFPRVDAKASALFAIDAAILAVMAAHLRAAHLEKWYVIIPAVVAAVAVIVALVFLYICAFPHLKGGGGSLVYFGEISRRTEVTFASEFKSATADERLDDLISQIWRNSQILGIKFHAVKWAFIWTAVALAPWCWYLAASSWTAG